MQGPGSGIMKAAREQAVIQALRRPRYEVTPLVGGSLIRSPRWLETQSVNHLRSVPYGLDCLDGQRPVAHHVRQRRQSVGHGWARCDIVASLVMAVTVEGR